MCGNSRSRAAGKEEGIRLEGEWQACREEGKKLEYLVKGHLERGGQLLLAVSSSCFKDLGPSRAC